MQKEHIYIIWRNIYIWNYSDKQGAAAVLGHQEPAGRSNVPTLGAEPSTAPAPLGWCPCTRLHPPGCPASCLRKYTHMWTNFLSGIHICSYTWLSYGNLEFIFIAINFKVAFFNNLFLPKPVIFTLIKAIVLNFSTLVSSETQEHRWADRQKLTC